MRTPAARSVTRPWWTSAVLVAAAVAVVLAGVTGGPDLGDVDVPGRSRDGGAAGNAPPRFEPAGLPAELRCLDDAGRTAEGCVAWAARSSPRPGPAGGPVLVRGPTSWLGTPRGVVSISTRDGSHRWATATSAPVVRLGAVGPGRLVAVDENRTAYGLRHLDGAVVWKTAVGSASVAEPVAVAGVVVVPTEDGLVGVSADTGGILFQTALEGTPGPVAAAAGLAVATDESGQVYGIDPTDGSITWRSSAGGRAPWLLVPGGGLVVTVTPDGEVSAIVAEDGTIRWRRRPTIGPVEEPVMGPDGRRIYLPTDDGTSVTAGIVDAASGREVGQAGLGASPVELAVDPQGWLLATSPGRLEVRDPDDGRLLGGLEHGSSRVTGVDTGFLAASSRQGHAIVSFADGTVAAMHVPTRNRRLEVLRDDLEQGSAAGLEDGAGCPASVADRRTYGTVLVGSTVEVLGADADPDVRGRALVFDVLLDLPERVSVSATRLDAAGTLTLTGPRGRTGDEVALAAGDRRFTVNHPPHWEITFDAPEEGCWAYVLRGADPLDVLDVIVFDRGPP